MPIITGDEFQQFSYFINNRYEPKKKNRFMLHLQDVPQLNADRTASVRSGNNYVSGLMISLDTASRPEYVVNTAEIRRYNERSYYAQEPSMTKEMSCSFFDYINNASPSADPGVNNGISAAQIIYRWFLTVYNLDFGSMGFKEEYATEADLYLLDPHGQQIEQWHYTSFWPKDVKFGDLSMNGPENCKIDVIFQFDKAKMINAIDTAADSGGTHGVHSSSEYS